MRIIQKPKADKASWQHLHADQDIDGAAPAKASDPDVDAAVAEIEETG